MKTTVNTANRYPHEKNKVLENFRASENFFQSDLILKNYLKNNVSEKGLEYMQDKLQTTGKQAAGVMNELSMLADKMGPELVKRNMLGETINEIRFHPAYWDLMKIAVESEMFRVKWEPALRAQFRDETQRLGFATGYLYAMSECGQYCPLCMTDGVARLIDLFCSDEDKARLLPHIYTEKAEELFTGAMFLTEKTGGSDVGANIVTATHKEGEMYLLNGEKWFCSNANAELIFALARTDENIKGTRGLSIFMIEKNLASGRQNPMDVVRLKDKLGVRSMASAEIVLTNTEGKRVGNEFEGFKVMVEMVSLSRLYNSVAALAASRRALVEAYQFLQHRTTFGKNALHHALIRSKLTELGTLNVANFYLVWRAIKALDLSDSGNEHEAQLFRMINPMTKKWSAEKGVYITRESMELMGGLGYIEDGVMPKLMRDVIVLPIWEGSGNIIVLDMLRAMQKSNGFEALCKEVMDSAAKSVEYGTWLKAELNKLIVFAEKLRALAQDEMETSAKPFFEKLTSLYQISLLIDALNEESKAWITPALNWLIAKYSPSELKEVKPLPVEEVRGLLAWEF
ncbi:MAG: Crotonobetainyl-CoA dehydrogenase [Bacteroidia bacterium]|nr:Crotonobetainyl-CoA dehydrogenase [Bacteroidia bacterium]